ncbi:uncharacterized protein EI90DRAFT_3038116, partial [Cantharellus anzutake]|uniref:uncharacterized protein n=1 Tax=Cantharellus anzutake TaxID=1750568 RepID=UPI0019052EE3
MSSGSSRLFLPSQVPSTVNSLISEWSTPIQVHLIIFFRWSSIVFMTPLSALPWWRSLWIRRAPLVFLVLSVISFSAGVVFFTFSHFSNHPIIPFCVTAASAVSAAGLFFVGTWFIAEYFSFGSGTKTGDEH